MQPILDYQNTQLHSLVAKAQQIQNLNSKVKRYLDIELAKHCKVANWKDGCLTIAAANASWVTRLRYMIPDLLEKLRKEAKIYNLARIECFVDRQFEKEKHTEQVKHVMSESASENIHSVAETIENPELKAALERLAKNKE